MEGQSFELEILTPAEKARQARNNKICEEYKKLKASTNARPWRIFSALSERFGMTPTGIYFVVRDGGLYASRSI